LEAGSAIKRAKAPAQVLHQVRAPLAQPPEKLRQICDALLERSQWRMIETAKV